LQPTVSIPQQFKLFSANQIHRNQRNIPTAVTAFYLTEGIWKVTLKRDGSLKVTKALGVEFSLTIKQTGDWCHIPAESMNCLLIVSSIETDLLSSHEVFNFVGICHNNTVFSKEKEGKYLCALFYSRMPSIS
jgi:hypothetical protein